MAKLCGVIDGFDCNGCASFSKFRGCLVELREKEFKTLLQEYKKIGTNKNYEQYKNVVINFAKKT
jgi:hypothetical protein